MVKNRAKNIMTKYGMLVALIFLCVIITLLNENFIRPQNLINILRQVSTIGIVAFGVTLVIISGGIDLSSGSIVAFSGVITASLVQLEPNIWTGLASGNLILGLAGGLIAGILAGAINGTIIALTKIPPFIATLGMMQIARGATLVFSSGRPIDKLLDGYLYIGTGSIFGIPIPVVIYLLLGIIAAIILKKMRIGKYIYAIGGSEQAAKVCGINIARVKIFIYSFAGMMAGFSAIILTARVSSGNPTAGEGYELDAIAAAVIGGASLSGGIGSIFGTVIGALIIGVLNNGLTLLNVSPYLQQIIKGIILIGAVMADAYKNKQTK